VFVEYIILLALHTFEVAGVVLSVAHHRLLCVGCTQLLSTALNAALVASQWQHRARSFPLPQPEKQNL